MPVVHLPTRVQRRQFSFSTTSRPSPPTSRVSPSIRHHQLRSRAASNDAESFVNSLAATATVPTRGRDRPSIAVPLDRSWSSHEHHPSCRRIEEWLSSPHAQRVFAAADPTFDAEEGGDSCRGATPARRNMVDEDGQWVLRAGHMRPPEVRFYRFVLLFEVSFALPLTLRLDPASDAGAFISTTSPGSPRKLAPLLLVCLTPFSPSPSQIMPGERDPVDTSLIITDGTRQHRPTRRAQGLDDAVPLGMPTAGQKSSSGKRPPDPDTALPGSAASKKGKSAFEGSSIASRKAHTQFKPVFPAAARPRGSAQGPQTTMDLSKPVGDAVDESGRLRDASEMEWPDSPSSKSDARWDIPPLSDDDDEDMRLFGTGKVARGREDQQEDGGGHAQDNDSSNDDEDDEGAANVKRGKRKASQDRESEEEGEGEEEEEEEEEPETEDEGLKRYNTLMERMGKNKLKKTHKTLDLSVIFKPDVRKVNGAEREGHYCTLCLEAKPKEPVSAFLLGNVSSRRAHITRTAGHYTEYHKRCTAKGYELKAQAPKGWRDPSAVKAGGSSGLLRDGSIQKFTVKQIPTPKVTKHSLLEYVLEFFLDADLSFRSVNRASFQRLCCFLNPKLSIDMIPHRTMLTDAIIEKGERLEEIDLRIIANIKSKVTIVWDGWSTKNRRSFTALGLQYIDEVEGNDWVLKNLLLAFEPSVGRHTGKAIGRELVTTIRQYHFEDKIGWTVGDNLQSNDVGVRYMCKKINEHRSRAPLNPKEVRGRCISHTVHLGPSHFLKSLKIVGVVASKKKLRKPKPTPAPNADDSDDDEVSPEDEYDEDLDVDMNMAVEASLDSPEEVIETTVVEYDPGDVIGKVMAFVNQFRSCGEGTHKYYVEICVAVKVMARKMKLWVRTRWGSLSDCLEAILSMRKAVDRFCDLADHEDSIPPLRNGNKWSDFKLTSGEWEIVRLAYNVLKEAAIIHADLSSQSVAMLPVVFPLLEKLMSKWDRMAASPEYAPVKDAIKAATDNMIKWYRSTDETTVYFIAHVLNPVRKDAYVRSAWESKYVDEGMKNMRERFIEYKDEYDAEIKAGAMGNAAAARPVTQTPSASQADDWMDEIIESAQVPRSSPMPSINQYEELDRYFSDALLPKEECPDPIKWWGKYGSKYPVLRRMAQDYLAVPASSCLIERAFSMSARTDDPCRSGMGGVKFGKTQQLKDAYRQGRLQAVKEAWVTIDPKFDFDSFMES
ncbi:hypothetical protein D9611_014619 [Ephemerocybe angulata]|uniref:HAT C-terminal dimerisation domain-containing protein n=1 Tax=Ephemerocybe angulata TaxID=980116 RepID=A0A8H5CAJ0_9AGAR|nr:hypothetical protein D9611_014619 [Tulosesus angulatus]